MEVIRMLNPRSLYIVIDRDLNRFWKYRWWLAGLVTMNLADLFIFALVFNNMVRRDLIPNYFIFMAPGITAIASFASAFSIGREVGVEVRREYTQYLLSLPISRYELAIGRILSGTVRGLIYQTPFMILTIILIKIPEPLNLAEMILASALLASTMSSLSIAISTSTKNFDMQATLRSFSYFILFFISNVFYPDPLIKTRFPGPLYTVAILNPISLTVSLYREILGISPSAFSTYQILMLLGVWLIIALVLGGYFYLRNLER
ncbi:MAG: ABC transporter permease [Sulfolobales archaeon]